MKFEFKRVRTDKIPRDKMMYELEKAAKIFNYTEFGWRDFSKVASISATSVKREFDGSWKKALLALRQHLNERKLDLLPRQSPPNRIHSGKDMFEELERIWSKLGHRPSRTEWESSMPRIHYNTYKQRFQGWQNACLKFIEYKMGEGVGLVEAPAKIEAVEVVRKRKEVFQHSDARSISLKVRLTVLDRDKFRCVFCGRSPATDIGVKLHIDHRMPFSKGGRTALDNLQTLCHECNLGKSNSELQGDGRDP